MTSEWSSGPVPAGSAFAELASEACRLAGHPLPAEVRRAAQGSALVIHLGEVAEGEGRRLSDALKLFRAARGIDAQFAIFSSTSSVVADGGAR